MVQIALGDLSGVKAAVGEKGVGPAVGALAVKAMSAGRSSIARMTEIVLPPGYRIIAAREAVRGENPA